MNRLFILPFFFLPMLCSGQNYGLCMQVVATSGGSGAQANYNVSWTVGELVVNTVSGINNKVTQGFHQPDVCAVVSTWNLDLEALRLEVFPNPSSAFFTIRFADQDDLSLHVEAFDVLGKQVLRYVPLQDASGTVIDASAWPSGLYFLKIINNTTKATATIRLVRI